VFLLPFIVFYEIAVISSSADLLERAPYLGPSVLVETFVWVQTGLTSLGFGGKFVWVAPPLAVVVILATLQLTSGKRWRFYLSDMWRMAVECVLLAVPLVVLVLFINSLGPPRPEVARLDGDSSGTPTAAIEYCCPGALTTLSTGMVDNVAGLSWQYWAANIATGIGAGIYEELIFRLILICILMLLFQDVFRLDHRNSIVLSVLISAALFSAHHHIDFLSGQVNPGDPFDWTRFAFRTMAGVYFAILFAIRGFGITAGTHAFYDIIATIVNAVFFQQQ
jgi:membrane protease YdiL (CAAX protease family)